MRQHSFTADFETQSSLDGARVWAFSIAEISSLKIIKTGNNIDDFMNFIMNKNIDIYFHNLKFDGQFIVYWLLKNGWKYSDKKLPKTFDTLIGDNGMWYSITLYHSKHKKRYVKTVILDSFKKLPFSVDRIGKAFHLETTKGEIDFTLDREIGHELTDDEIDYVERDVLVTAEALQIQFNEGMKKMTIGSDSINGFKDSIGGNREFEFFFPILDPNVDDFIRLSYKGGFTWLNPKYKEINLKGLTFDVNSLYPYVMRYKPLPYGYPLMFEGKASPTRAYPLYIQRIRCSFYIKPNKIPTVQLKHTMGFIETEYLDSSKGEIIEMTLTSIDLELFLDHYETLNLEYGGGFYFKASRSLFENYIDHWSNVKETNVGAIRELAKLRLNSLYGKFATSIRKGTKYPYLDENDIINYKYNPIVEGKPVYTALASFVTAYAREITIKAAQLNYDRFIYADTDSIHLEGFEIPTNIKIHNTKLGYWQHENSFTESKYIRAKTYIQKIDDTWKHTVAGMPYYMHSQITFDNFKEGMKYDGKLLPKRVVGGVHLEPTTYEIRKSIKYDDYDLMDELAEINRETHNILKSYLHKINMTHIRKDINYTFGKSNKFLMWHNANGITADQVKDELTHYGIFLTSITEADIMIELIKLYEQTR